MRKNNVVMKILLFVVIFSIIALFSSSVALAETSGNETSENTTTAAATETTPALYLACQYPVQRNNAGEMYVFYVALYYSGDAPQLFTLKATAPPKWNAAVYRESEIIEVPQLEITPNKYIPDVVRVALFPPTYEYPLAGEYHANFQISSGDIEQSLDLTALVTDLYEYSLVPTSGNLYDNIISGKENHISLSLYNNGTTPVQDISLSSMSKPEGWNISFNPPVISSLDIGVTKEIDMLVTTSSNTKAGDYSIKLQANPAKLLPTVAVSADSTSSSTSTIDMRITVLSSSHLGWVAIGIIVVILAGVVFIFRYTGII